MPSAAAASPTAADGAVVRQAEQRARRGSPGSARPPRSQASAPSVRPASSAASRACSPRASASSPASRAAMWLKLLAQRADLVARQPARPPARVASRDGRRHRFQPPHRPGHAARQQPARRRPPGRRQRGPARRTPRRSRSRMPSMSARDCAASTTPMVPAGRRGVTPRIGCAGVDQARPLHGRQRQRQQARGQQADHGGAGAVRARGGIRRQGQQQRAV